MGTEARKIHKFQAHDLKILSVTVYTDRAEVKRNVTTELEPGLNKIIIEKIPQTANDDSIIVNGRGDGIIHEVQVNNTPVFPDESSNPRLQDLNDEKKKLEEERTAIKNRQKVIRKRQELLDSFVEKVGDAVVHLKDGESQRIIAFDSTFENIAKLIQYHQDEHIKILDETCQIEKELCEKNEKIRKLQEQIGFSGLNHTHIKNISIMLESEKGGKVDLDVSYQVSNASWHPTYELRLQSAEKALKLTYFGNISQSSGEDWIDTPLILSTVQPSLGGMAPRLGTLIAEFYKPPPPPPPSQPVYFGYKMMPKAFGHTKALRAESTEGYDNLELASVEERRAGIPPPQMSHAPIDVDTSGASAMFMITHSVSIPSDSAYHKVVISTINLQSTLYYETVPSKNTNVYLYALAINDSSMPFLAGEASIYVDNSYIAKNSVKDVSPGGRFSCSLGVDPAIKVEYKPINTYKVEAGLITKLVTTMNEQKILIKNTKPSAALIIVRRHIPKSTDEKIKIKLFSPELNNKDTNVGKSDAEPAIGARLDSNHNLEWGINVEPNKEEELTIKWSTEHPKEETITFREVFSQGNLE